MNLSLDQNILWEYGYLHLNLTILYTWFVMAILVGLALIFRYQILHKRKSKRISKLQNFLEAIIAILDNQIGGMSEGKGRHLLPLIGTLFMFILLSNLLSLIPGINPPTSSLSTTSALALFIFCSSIYFGVKSRGFFGYLKKFTQPVAFMLPMNIVSEISSNCALAVRLYGNMMSGVVIGAVLLKIAFLMWGFPVFIQLLGTVSAIIQAYIFSILALVFITSAERD